MLSQSLYEQSAVKAFVDNGIEQHHDVRHLVFTRQVDNLKVVFSIKYVQVFDNLLIRDVALTERNSLVEDAQCVAHTAVGFLGNDGQRLFFIADSFLFGNRLQMVDSIADGHPLKVVDLTPA